MELVNKAANCAVDLVHSASDALWWPEAVPQEWRVRVTGGTAAAITLYVAYKHLFTTPGFDPPPPGSLYLGLGSRKTFEKACDMKTDPFVFDISKEPFVKPIEQNWTVVRDELKAYTASTGGRLAPFGHTHRMSSKACWRVLSLRLWGITAPNADEFFPNALALLHRVFPGKDWNRVVGITFSQLEPNSNIAPHYGDTNANYRCHLGLIVPAKLPHAGMRIGTEERSWEEGRMFAFNDAHYHRAWNECDQRRFILILDIMRNEHLSSRNHVCRYVMGSFLLQRLTNVWGWIKKSKWLEHYTHRLFYLLLFLPVNFGIGSGFIHSILRS